MAEVRPHLYKTYKTLKLPTGVNLTLNLVNAAWSLHRHKN